MLGAIMQYWVLSSVNDRVTNVVHGHRTFWLEIKFSPKVFTHSSSHIICVIVRYFALAENQDTASYFLLLYMTRLHLTIWYLVVDFVSPFFLAYLISGKTEI